MGGAWSCGCGQGCGPVGRGLVVWAGHDLWVGSWSCGWGVILWMGAWSVDGGMVMWTGLWSSVGAWSCGAVVFGWGHGGVKAWSVNGV